MKKENTDINNIDKSEDKPKRNYKRKTTKNTVKKQKELDQPKKSSKGNIKPLSLKDSYGVYLKEKNPFRIYLNGKVIYDSGKQNINVEFLEDYFILGDSKYEYKGIKVEKYNK